MEKREIAKFLSGFFAAGALLTLSIILLAAYPQFKAISQILDFQTWTVSLMGFLVLAVIFAFLGWGWRTGRKYTTLVIMMVVVFSFYISFDVLKIKNINLFQSSVASALLQDKSNQAVAPTNQTIEDSKIIDGFSFNLGLDKNDGGKVITADTAGNLYLAGYFQGTINLDVLGGLTEINSMGNSLISSAVDIYVAKYTSEKKLLWGFSIGSSGKDMPLDLKIDAQGNFYLAGYFGGLADFNPSQNEEYSLDAGIGRDAFLSKYNSDGKFQWAKKIGNAEKIPFTENDLRFEEARSIALDQNNNVYLTGVFDGTVNLDDPNLSTPLNTFSNSYTRDIFLAIYDSNGIYLKGMTIGGIGQEEVRGIGVDKDNSIYLTGAYAGKLNFDTKNKENKATLVFSNGNLDSFLVKYDANLNYLWNKKWGGANNDDPMAGLVIDRADNIYLAGNFSESISFGSKKLSASGSSNVFFAEYNKAGELKMAKKFGNSFASVSSIYLDKDNNMYLTGAFKTSCNFNPGQGSQTLIAISDGLASDGFIVKYSANGDYLWARDLGGLVSLENEIQSAESITTDSNNNPIITGYFYKKINFNSTESLDLISSGATDAYVVKYNSSGEIE